MKFKNFKDRQKDFEKVFIKTQAGESAGNQVMITPSEFDPSDPDSEASHQIEKINRYLSEGRRIKPKTRLGKAFAAYKNDPDYAQYITQD